MNAKKNVSMKTVALLLAVVLLIGCVAGGTTAWLIAEPRTVENTFVAGQIGTLELTETVPANKSAIVTPGVDIAKDPTVTFSGNNVDAFVFVQVTADQWTSDETTRKNYSGVNGKVTWSIDDSWTLVTGTTNVYYQEVAANGTLNAAIIKNNAVMVADTIIAGEMASDITLKFTAYAIQQEKNSSADFTPAEAWVAVQADANP